MFSAISSTITHKHPKKYTIWHTTHTTQVADVEPVRNDTLRTRSFLGMAMRRMLRRPCVSALRPASTHQPLWVNEGLEVVDRVDGDEPFNPFGIPRGRASSLSSDLSSASAVRGHRLHNYFILWVICGLSIYICFTYMVCWSMSDLYHWHLFSIRGSSI
jgi:hypothetical protein